MDDISSYTPSYNVFNTHTYDLWHVQYRRNLKFGIAFAFLVRDSDSRFEDLGLELNKSIWINDSCTNFVVDA